MDEGKRIRRVAEQFRHYEMKCRAKAKAVQSCELRDLLLDRAKHWQLDAEMVEKDAELVETSRARMARVDAGLGLKRY